MADRWHKLSQSPTTSGPGDGVAPMSAADLFRPAPEAAAVPLDEKLRQTYYWIVNRAVISPYYDVEFSSGAPLAFSLGDAGAEITDVPNGIRIHRNGNGIRPVDVVTDPFPGFPTDLQAQFMALMTRADGVSHITETIFENRFMHVQELARLGARISLSGQMARIEGVPRLAGAPVMATDLRASVSLVIGGLAAEGETTVNRVYHLDRGFERLEEKLGACGAEIERISS